MTYYYSHPEANTLHTEIVSAEKEKKGWLIELKDTIFYPEGGGQPADTGLLAGQPVLDVQKAGSRILHRIKDKPLTSTVVLELNRSHRDFYSICHTGQHLISGIFFKCYGLHTISAHFNKEEINIEIERTEITDSEIAGVEKIAAEVIAANCPVTAFWIKNQEELKQYAIRSSSSVAQNIRLVEIEGWDLTPCGGLHVKSTAALGLIKYSGKEKVRGHLRLKWLIGSTAFKEYDMLKKEMRKISNILSVPPHEASVRLGEVLHEKQEALNLLKKAEEKMAAAICRELVAADTTACSGIILQNLNDCTLSLFQEICQQLAGKEHFSFLLTCPVEEGIRWVLYLPDQDDFDFTCFKDICLPCISGKGGGRAPRWQGVGSRVKGIEAFFSAVKQLVNNKRAE